MSNLNLYNYYDKSLADINREYLNSRKVRKTKAKETSKGKKVFLLMLLAIAITVPVGIFVGKQLSDTALEVILPKEPPKADLRSTEEKLGYVKVQIFEFADEAAPISVDEAKAKQAQIQQNEIEKNKSDKDEKEATEALIAARKEYIPKVEEEEKKLEEKQVAKADKPVENKKENIKPPTPATKATPVEKKYSILFEDIDNTQFDTINSLASEYRVTSEIKESIKNYNVYWRVYRLSPESKLVIGGKNVEKVRDFKDKEEAITFAKEHNIQSVIRLEEENNNIYTVSLCCISLDSAKKIAESSNIMNKTIKIIREK